MKSEGEWRTLSGAEVAALLRKKLRSDLNLLTYPVLDVDTAICQNNCSGMFHLQTRINDLLNLLYLVGHGVCDQYSRRCVCQSFWMENPIKVSNSGDYNCGRKSNVKLEVFTQCILIELQIGAWFTSLLLLESSFLLFWPLAVTLFSRASAEVFRAKSTSRKSVVGRIVTLP